MTESDQWRAALAACSVMTLPEAVEIGAIGPNIYAVRRAMQRDPDFPSHVGMRGPVGLFNVDDLRAYAAKTAKAAAIQAAEPPDQGPEREETWKPVAKMDGCTFSAYEASDKGRARSVDRQIGNRQARGVTFKAKPSKDGYVRIKLSCDNPGHGAHTVTMHKIILTTFDQACPPGMEACHSDRGPAFNWWPEGIRWDTWKENDAERTAALAAKGRAANGRPMAAPKPPVMCVRCGAPATRGRRCHECVVAIGQEAGDMLRAGVKLEDANERIGYGNAVYLHTLAVTYGGWGQCPTCSRSATKSPAVTLRERLGRALRPQRRHGE